VDSRRKADREAMTTELGRIAVGCEFEAFFDGRDVVISIRHPTGLELATEITGLHLPNVYVLSWGSEGRKLAPAVWASLNTVHFLKATDICYGWDDLRDTVTRRLAQAADFTAFQ
jgi:hypothetical protein